MLLAHGTTEIHEKFSLVRNNRNANKLAVRNPFQQFPRNYNPAWSRKNPLGNQVCQPFLIPIKIPITPATRRSYRFLFRRALSIFPRRSRIPMYAESGVASRKVNRVLYTRTPAARIYTLISSGRVSFVCSGGSLLSIRLRFPRKVDSAVPAPRRWTK